ncbi:hypothetical protein SKAU_G00182300 [Synaphobranchus kaupii]|uniref:Uncharacterized protein n=1 Tax=Synaphobranchus kaupii TaxID=118154 RepID=A0A9Q1IW19_SYNKA|nr:hypothetical protein SKAU_G00182300 [Synaphobranchus kaupii]
MRDVIAQRSGWLICTRGGVGLFLSTRPGILSHRQASPRASLRRTHLSPLRARPLKHQQTLSDGKRHGNRLRSSQRESLTNSARARGVACARDLGREERRGDGWGGVGTLEVHLPF